MPPHERLYAVASVARHLFEAKQHERLHLLFIDDGWMRARFSVGGAYGGYLDDLNIAWAAIGAQLERQPAATDVDELGDLFRYGLIRGSIASLSRNVDPSLVLRAVELGEWSPDRAVDVAARSGDQEHRRRLCLALLNSDILPVEAANEALQHAIAAALASPRRMATLESLATRAQGEARERVLRLALSARKYEDCERLLFALAPRLDQRLLAEALDGVLARDDWKQPARIWLLTALIPHLKGVLVEPAFQAVWDAREWEVADDALAALAPLLPIPLVDRVVKEIEQTSHNLVVPQLTVAVCNHLSLPQLERVTRCALRWEEEPFTQAFTLATIVSRTRNPLREPLRQEAIDAALRAAPFVESRLWQLDIQRMLLPSLPEEKHQPLARAAISQAAQLPDFGNSFLLMLGFAKFLTGSERNATRRQAVARLFQLEEPDRFDFLSATLPILDPDVFDDVLDQLSGLDDRRSRLKDYLVLLGPRLPDHLLPRATNLLLSIDNGSNLAAALSSIAGRLAPGEVEHCLLHLSREISPYMVVEPMVVLAPYVPDSALPLAMRITRAVEQSGEPYDRARVLAALAPRLQAEERKTALERGFAAAAACEEDYQRQSALEALAPQFDREQLVNALQPSFEADSMAGPIKALAALSGYLPPKRSAGLIAECLDLLDGLQRDDEDRVEALAAVAEQLSPGAAHLALQLVLSWPSGKGEGRLSLLHPAPGASRAKGLTAIASHLGDDQFPVALQAARELYSDEQRAKAYAALACGPGRHHPEPIFEAAMKLQPGHLRARVIAALAPSLPPDKVQLALDTTLEYEVDDLTDRGETLRALGPRLSREQTRQALKAIRSFRYEPDREWSLSGLAAGVAATAPDLALESMRSITYWRWMSTTLPAVAAHVGDNDVRQLLTATLDSIGSDDVQGERADVSTIIALIPHLTGSDRVLALDAALAAIGQMSGKGCAEALAMLGPYLEGHRMETALVQTLRLSPETPEFDDSPLGIAMRGPTPLSAAERMSLQPSDQWISPGRSVRMVGLASYLTLTQRTRAMPIVMYITDDRDRAVTLTALATSEPALPDALGAARLALRGVLESAADHGRPRVLASCTDKLMYRPPLVPTAVLDATANHIFEIMRDWRWL